ncbi:MAG: hypothetical protein WDN75_19505 [Bacteroidota bacterium]
MEDVFLEEYRTTWIAGLLSSLGLAYHLSGDKQDEQHAILDFCKKHERKFNLWGESAVPSMLSYYWLYRKLNATQSPDALLLNVIRNNFV